MNRGPINVKDSNIQLLCDEYVKNNVIAPEEFERYGVKRGLRNSDGTGVMAGLTLICNVHGYVLDEGEKSPVDGKLTYRGIDIRDIIDGCVREGRFGFEETIWLLLFGSLPTKTQLQYFQNVIEQYRDLPDDFAEDMLLKAPSSSIMNMLCRSVLALYTYDENADDTSLENVMRQSIELIGCMPTIMVLAYQVKRRHYDHKSMYFHPSVPGHSIAQNILSTMRSNKKFTDEEARLLDICLMLHAEHGGGNNSTFATRVLSSTGTDTYSAIAAGIGSLKGPKHGGANLKVMEMLDAIKEGVKNPNDDGEIKDFLCKIINKEAGDRSGLIYGMGHAVYTKSDPRSVILKENILKNLAGSEFEVDYTLLNAVERLAPEVFFDNKHQSKVISANVDLYSGLVYRMLKIPQDLFTPLFAVARIAGWCAHRMEEILTANRIMRPAYKAIAAYQDYVPMEERN